MKAVQVRFALLAIAAILAVAAAVSTVNAEAFLPSDPPVTSLHQEGGSQGQDDGGGTDIVTVAAWTAAGIAVGGLVLGVLYMFKRRVGGFPENPSWIAPISIMESDTFPDEDDFGDQVPSHQAHAEH